jgi:hypothetical protein
MTGSADARRVRAARRTARTLIRLRIGALSAQSGAHFSGSVAGRGRRDGSPPLGGGSFLFLHAARDRRRGQL